MCLNNKTFTQVGNHLFKTTDVCILAPGPLPFPVCIKLITGLWAYFLKFFIIATLDMYSSPEDYDDPEGLCAA